MSQRSGQGQRALSTALGAGYAFQSTENLAHATDLVLNDSAHLSQLVEQWAACGADKVQGRTFEFLETLRFNADATLKGSDLAAHMTAPASPHHPADIQIQRGADVIKDVQAKSYADKYAALRQLSSDKYDGMDLLVPSDKVDELKDLAQKGAERHPEGIYTTDYVDVRDRLTGELKADDVSSGGTTRAEARRAAEHPEAAIRRLNGEVVLKEVGTAAARGAAVGGAFGLVFSAAGNTVAVKRGEKSLASATVDTAAGAVSAGVRAGTVTGGAKVIAIAARHQGANTFASGVGPAAVANGVWEAAAALHRFASGETDAAQAVEEVGTVIVRGTAVYYGGIVGQIICPVPVAGALAGAIVGYTGGVVINQAALLTLAARREAAEAHKNRLQVEQLCRDAIARIDLYQAQIIAIAEREDVVFEREILMPVDRLNDAVLYGDPAQIMIELAGLNSAFYAALPFRNLDEFSGLMLDPESRLSF